MGRFVYCSYIIKGTWDKRRVHAMLMGLAVLGAVLGYVCVFMAHLPMQQFFGYDFKNHEWKPFLRISHVYIGYSSVLLSLAQAGMGIAKVRSLAEGEDRKIFTSHGNIGKALILLGGANVIIATVFWGWSLMTTSIIIALSGPVLVFGVALPRAAVDNNEGIPLAAPRFSG